MAGDSQTHPVRLIHDRFDFLPRQRRRSHQRAVGLEFVVFRAREVYGGVNLDPVGSVQFAFAHGLTSQPGGIHVLAGEHIIAPRFRGGTPRRGRPAAGGSAQADPTPAIRSPRISTTWFVSTVPDLPSYKRPART